MKNQEYDQPCTYNIICEIKTLKKQKYKLNNSTFST
jgi:hypothetical protein